MFVQNLWNLFSISDTLEFSQYQYLLKFCCANVEFVDRCGPFFCFCFFLKLVHFKRQGFISRVQGLNIPCFQELPKLASYILQDYVPFLFLQRQFVAGMKLLGSRYQEHLTVEFFFL